MIDIGLHYKQEVWNPVSGCDKISAGCDNCYALRSSRRLRAFGVEKYQTDGHPVTSGPGFGLAVHPAALDQPRRWRKPRMVFATSMSDLFHARVPLSFVRDVFAVMADTPQHLYQVLTKRPSRARKVADELVWPDNVWVGTSVESQDVRHRMDDLRALPAALRFVFFEPLLGRCQDSTWRASVGCRSGAKPPRVPGPWTPPGSAVYAISAWPRACPLSSSSGVGAAPGQGAVSSMVAPGTSCRWGCGPRRPRA